MGVGSLTSNWVVALGLGVSHWFTALDASGIFKSTNSGVNWTSSFTYGLNTNATSFLIDGSNVFFGTFNQGIYRSTDNGMNWAQANNGLSNLNVRCFTFTSNFIIAGTSGSGIFLSTNNGDTWGRVADAGLTDLNIWTILCIDNSIFAGTSSGVFLSTNEGINWNKANTGLKHVSIFSLTVNNGYLYAGTGGSAVWRRPLSEMITDVEDVNQVPNHFALEQNYPNPFNPSTKISWQAPVGSWQTLKVYDVLGNEVSTLVNEYKPAGDYEIEFSATNLPSGVYFYRLEAGTISETKKLILLK